MRGSLAKAWRSRAVRVRVAWDQRAASEPTRSVRGWPVRAVRVRAAAAHTSLGASSPMRGDIGLGASGEHAHAVDVEAQAVARRGASPAGAEAITGGEVDGAVSPVEAGGGRRLLLL